jgi:hypothetical protein
MVMAELSESGLDARSGEGEGEQGSGEVEAEAAVQHGAQAGTKSKRA